MLLWTYFVLFACVIILLLEVTCYILVRSMLDREATESLNRIGDEASQYFAVHGPEATQRYILDFREDGMNIHLVAADGSVIIPNDEEDLDFSAELEKFNSRVQGGNSNQSIIFTYGGKLNYVAAARAGNFIIVTYSLHVAHKALGALIIYFVIVGVIAIVVSILVGYSISQKLSRGIRNISANAVKLGKGDFSVEFSNAEYKEIADLSDTLNRVRDEVKKSGDFQRELLANVSHDLKTPLTMIKAYASMVREISGDNPEKRNQHLQVIIDEADRLTALVNDVLNVSKVSSNIDALNVKVFNLTEFLYGIVDKFGYLRETQGYTLDIEADPDLYTRADEEKIGQVLYNLISNAVNYTGEDKKVFIKLNLAAEGDRIKFSVRDTGKGISEEELPEIWNRYYRSKETHSRPVKGSGLGLSIVKVVLESHKFDFGVESEIGKGSVFWVDFPAVGGETDEDLP